MHTLFTHQFVAVSQILLFAGIFSNNFTTGKGGSHSWHRRVIFIAFLVAMTLIFTPVAHAQGRHPVVKQGFVVAALLVFVPFKKDGGFAQTMDQVFTR